MTGIASTALTGFFILSNFVGPLTGGGVLQNSEAISSPAEAEVLALESLKTLTVAMTGYNAVPEQTDSDPFITASGAYSNPEIMAARSVDLAGELPFGTVIEIKNVPKSDRGCAYQFAEPYVGLRVIGDSMHPRKRQQIDLLFDKDILVNTGGRKLNPAVALGYCKQVEISVVGFVAIKNLPDTQAELRAMVGRSNLVVNK